MTVKFTANRQNDKVFAKIEGIEKLTRRGLRQGSFKAGHAIIGEASREILKGPKTGKTYIRRDKAGRRRRHMASAPGETHANLSGAARRSLSFQIRGATELEVGYGVSSGKSAPDHAKMIEFGTSKMKARPSVGNAINSEQGNITQHFEHEILKANK